MHAGISSLCFLVALLLEIPVLIIATDLGFDLLYKSNNAILRDIPMLFDTPLPAWINGTIIHNGPAMFEVNNRNLTHLFDGFAKPISWHFDGSGHAKFSTEFLKTDSYLQSLRISDVAPYFLFLPPNPPFSWRKKMQQLVHGMDNVNINVARVRGQFMFLSDIWKVYVGKPHVLRDVSVVEPDVPERYRMLRRMALSSSHPLSFDSSDPQGPLLNFFVEPIFGGMQVHLCKVVTPTKRIFFAEVPMNRLPYMHSFGATNRHVILFGHPLYMNVFEIFESEAALNAFMWEPELGSTIYIVNKRSGAVHNFHASSMVMTHFVNAYETNAGKIIADFVTYPDPSPFKMFEMDIMTNSTRRNNANVYLSRIRRFAFDLGHNVSVEMSTPNFDGLANRLEMPVINENYRYHSYCYVFGLTMNSNKTDFADFRLVKRDLCEGKDLVWSKPGFYPSEPRFVPRPGAIEEDDGLLLCTILDGIKKVSYLGVFDGKTLTEVNKSYLPTYIPFLLHGNYFPTL